MFSPKRKSIPENLLFPFMTTNSRANRTYTKSSNGEKKQLREVKFALIFFSRFHFRDILIPMDTSKFRWVPAQPWRFVWNIFNLLLWHKRIGKCLTIPTSGAPNEVQVRGKFTQRDIAEKMVRPAYLADLIKCPTAIECFSTTGQRQTYIRTFLCDLSERSRFSKRKMAVRVQVPPA